MRGLASIVVMATLSQGCSVIGLTVGLATPSTETIDSRNLVVVDPGTDMKVEVAVADSRRTATIQGRFASVTEDVVVIESEEGRFEVNRRWIRKVTIESGTQWGKGLIIGGTVDAGLLLLGLLLESGVGH